MRGRQRSVDSKERKRSAKGKKTNEAKRGTQRRRVRKSECHCRNLRTLTSFWLVPPPPPLSSLSSRTPSTRRKPSLPPSPHAPPGSSVLFVLSFSPARSSSRDSSTWPLASSFLPSPFAFPRSLSLPLARVSPSPPPPSPPFFFFNRGSLRRLVSLKYFRNDSRVNVSPLLELESFFFFLSPLLLPLFFFFFK